MPLHPWPLQAREHLERLEQELAGSPQENPRAEVAEFGSSQRNSSACDASDRRFQSDKRKFLVGELHRGPHRRLLTGFAFLKSCGTPIAHNRQEEQDNSSNESHQKPSLLRRVHACLIQEVAQGY